MFCQTCGNLITESLNYCNRCGARVTNALEFIETQRPTDKPTGVLITLLIVTGLVVLTGLGMLFPLIIILAEIGVKTDPIAVMLFFYLATLFGISFLLLRQFSKVLDVYLHGGNAQKKQKKNPEQSPQPAQLFERNTGQIEAPREPFISVTEHTTRILDPAQQERK
jgi:hypothetical protein